jgi:DNA (cytosine-5)-methyltransferase 1
MKKINVVTLFSGYDAMCLALERLKADFPLCFDYELIAWSEIDRFAIDAHNALFPQWADRNLGDVTQADYSTINEPIDLLIYSSCCQSVSLAGKRAGMKKGDDSAASALIWYTERAIEALKPKYLLLENVKGMITKKNKPDFDMWCETLKKHGYDNFYQVLNAKQFGVPQNRERVFMVSIRRDGATPESYTFPKPFPLERRLRDILEDSVDESYYLKQEQVDRIVAHCDRKVAEGCGFKTNFQEGGGISGAIKTKEGSREYDTYVKTTEPK